MSMDLTGITNQNEYYTNHYFSSFFEDGAENAISAWKAEAKEKENIRTPWAMLRDVARQYYPIHDRFLRSKFDMQTLVNIRTLADLYLKALGYSEAKPEVIEVDDSLKVPVYLEITKANGAPTLWILLATSDDKEEAILDKRLFDASQIVEEGLYSVPAELLTDRPNEEVITRILFGQTEPPRFLMLVGMNQIALIDRNKWNEKRYLQFELEDIFSRHEESTLQAMAVLLHKKSLCPEEGTALLDELDASSQKHAAGVSQDLKFALRESIELLGNEVLYDMSTRQGRDLDSNPIDAGELTLECLRYMYRMLFVLFIESRKDLGYAPILNEVYKTGYSLEGLRDIADDVRDDMAEVGDGYYLHETLSKLYDLIYDGYPGTEEELIKYSEEETLDAMFVIAPLKAHIFDPEYTKMITNAKLRNSCMLRIIDLMSLTRETGKRNERRGRISYANLGINQMGSVYEALLSYRGFIAKHTLFEVKRAGDSFNELDVGYFVSEEELDQYAEDERVRYEKDDPDGRFKKGQLRRYEKGTFIYRLAGREREKSASFYTPEVLTKCLVKYALKELLEGKTADEILHLTVCEPAMGSAAFLNEAITQLAEAYLDKKQKESGKMIAANDRLKELQKVKMYIADRNVYGIDLNPVAVELAEVSLWLNTIYEGGFVPWFGTQLINGNSLIGARRQAYRTDTLSATTKGLRWHENAPDRVPLGTKRMPKKQVYHFLLGDPGMCSYSDKVIKSLEPEKIKAMGAWNKKFTEPYSDDDITTLLRLSTVIDELWDAQVNLRKEVEAKTRDTLSVFGYEDQIVDSHTTIRQKDQILSELYKSEHMRNAGPYARLKFAMDYWCALWFWPIEKADLLPSRSEFLFDMSLILEGTTQSVVISSTEKGQIRGQMSLFPTEMQQLEFDILETYGTETIVDIPKLLKENQRLRLAHEIAENNHFMHWELEFADLFMERGGFDLIVGNPPWVKMEWDEMGVLSDKNPSFAIKNLKAAEITKHREEELENKISHDDYFCEYASMAGQQAFLGATANYPDIAGAVNLFKCFLPRAWEYGVSDGVSAFVHPDGVFDDPKGGLLREKLYPRLRKHFQFENELGLFEGTNDHGRMRFSLNVYGNTPTASFDAIANLFTPLTIDQCYDSSIKGIISGIKDENGNWSLNGHPGRVIRVRKNELELFAYLFDGSDNWKQARLPSLHVQAFTEVLRCFANQKNSIYSAPERVFTTEMWNETGAQKDGTIVRNVHFPENSADAIISGPHIWVANPKFKTSRKECVFNGDYDNLDFEYMQDEYRPRCNYSPNVPLDEYFGRVPGTPWGKKYTDEYRIVMRKMIGLSGERSLIPAIIPPGTGHIDGLFGIATQDNICFWGGLFASLPYDYLVKASGKSNCRYDLMSRVLLPDSDNLRASEIACIMLQLSCVDSRYARLWKETYSEGFNSRRWSKSDSRLNNNIYLSMRNTWDQSVFLRTDFERRQALVELDVLVAQAIGMTLCQLKDIYRIQFPVFHAYEDDTWYDVNGRIVFSAKNMGDLIYKRPEWENSVKGAISGTKFIRTIIDSTKPGDPFERTIEYVAPFDRCDREKDYETAWKFFEEKYGMK